MLKKGQNSSVGKATARIAVMFCLVALAGCATLSPSDEKAVEQKATARWNAIVANDFKTAYEFISPAGRSLVTLQAYENGIKRDFHKSARVKEVRCARDVCDVTLELEYEYAGRRIKTPLFEKWVRQDSDWWYLYQR